MKLEELVENINTLLEIDTQINEKNKALLFNFSSEKNGERAEILEIRNALCALRDKLLLAQKVNENDVNDLIEIFQLHNILNINDRDDKNNSLKILTLMSEEVRQCVCFVLKAKLSVESCAALTTTFENAANIQKLMLEQRYDFQLSLAYQKPSFTIGEASPSLTVQSDEDNVSLANPFTLFSNTLNQAYESVKSFITFRPGN
ncbi:MAG: hypothetical protein H0W64_07490 [Gammaproteobacteria bacterium]|nr:hypothetical protein [Gammaproteobacteria bacterium]